MAPDSINYDFTDPVTLARLIGLVVPILVAVVTKKVSSSGLKAVLNLVLSAIGGSVAYLAAADGHLDVPGYVNATLNTFVTSIITYYGLLKPTGITDTVTEKTKNFGIGTPPAPALETDDKGAEDAGAAVASYVTMSGGHGGGASSAHTVTGTGGTGSNATYTMTPPVITPPPAKKAAKAPAKKATAKKTTAKKTPPKKS